MSTKQFFQAGSLENDLVPWSVVAEAQNIYIRPSDGFFSINIDARQGDGLVIDYETREEAEDALLRLQQEFSRHRPGKRNSNLCSFSTVLAAAMTFLGGLALRGVMLGSMSRSVIVT
jgi:hypothetical protein